MLIFFPVQVTLKLDSLILRGTYLIKQSCFLKYFLKDLLDSKLQPAIDKL